MRQGGIKAVVWTDVFQAVVMLLGLIAITVVVRFIEYKHNMTWKTTTVKRGSVSVVLVLM